MKFTTIIYSDEGQELFKVENLPENVSIDLTIRDKEVIIKNEVK